MRYDFAPLEGLTDSFYRRLHYRYFGGVDRYFTPFFSPTVHRALTNREERELPPADSTGAVVVPQLLTKVPEDFVWMAQQCAQRGYTEVNLNLGCPSGTVTAKGKGAGMLADPENLDRFLDGIFNACPLPISIKTRLGISDPSEFEKLLDIYNRYPVCQLIVHPRVRKDFYNSPVCMELFSYAVGHSRAPVSYNGNLCTIAQIQSFARQYPQVDTVMIGRGLIADPGMLLPQGTSVQTLQAFHGELLEEYLISFHGSRNAMFRLKEHWRYLIRRFEENEKLAKRLRKTTDLNDFMAITSEFFHNVPLRPALCPDW